MALLLAGALTGAVALAGQPALETDPSASLQAAPHGPSYQTTSGPRPTELGSRPAGERRSGSTEVGLYPGDEIRLLSAASGPRWLKAKVLAVDDGTLVLRLRGHVGPTRIRLESVERLSVRAGTRTNVKEGALLGAAWGVVGGLGGVLAGPPEIRRERARRAATDAVMVTVLGALAGACVRSPRWTPVSTVELRAHVAPDPAGGFATMLALSF